MILNFSEWNMNSSSKITQLQNYRNLRNLCNSNFRKRKNFQPLRELKCCTSGACVLHTWHIKCIHCISTVKLLLDRLSSYVAWSDTISQPSHLPGVHRHKGMVCQRETGGEHICVYTHRTAPEEEPIIWSSPKSSFQFFRKRVSMTLADAR